MPTVAHRAGRRKSTYSDQGNGCLEVAFTDSGIVELSDSKLTDSPVIQFTVDQWASWLTELITGDLTDANGAVTVTPRPNAWTVQELTTGTTLIFTLRRLADRLRRRTRNEHVADFLPVLEATLARHPSDA